MRLLVCGGREFEKRVWAFERLDRFHAANPATLSSAVRRPVPTLMGKDGLNPRGITLTPNLAT
jgi:hypothetical protein